MNYLSYSWYAYIIIFQICMFTIKSNKLNKQYQLNLKLNNEFNQNYQTLYKKVYKDQTQQRNRETDSYLFGYKTAQKNIIQTMEIGNFKKITPSLSDTHTKDIKQKAFQTGYILAMMDAKKFLHENQ